MYIVAGIAEKSGKKLYNSSVLIGPKGVVSIYRKAHLFWNEKDVFNPGDTRLEVVSIGKARVGMMICFDWLFPEVAKALALKGADIICHPSNLVLPHCPEAMLTRTLENRVFAITANRVGTEDRGKGAALTFIGKSQVAAPGGELLVRAASKRAAFAAVDIDVSRARDKWITPRNHIFKDRRQDIF
jgi:predicted amidohydrolase